MTLEKIFEVTKTYVSGSAYMKTLKRNKSEAKLMIDYNFEQDATFDDDDEQDYEFHAFEQDYKYHGLEQDYEYHPFDAKYDSQGSIL